MSYRWEELERFAKRVMERAGLSPAESAVFSDSLLKAEMRGITSHGLTRLSAYAKRVELGLVAANVEPEILADGGTVLWVDGKNGMGAWVGTRVMELCVRRARERGSCFAAVCGGNHFGYAAYFAQQAARQDMVGFAVANGPSAIPPTGGVKPLLGTNPVAICIPAGRYRPLVLDMATSAVARGKVALAKKNGASIPTGWGVDSLGCPTTDPDAVLSGGAMLPMAGPKGYAISLIVELLCSCLAGGQDGQTMGSFYDLSRTQNTGYCLAALDVSKIIDLDVLKSRVDTLFDSMKACPRADGTAEIMIPGEIEYNNYDRALAEGISLSPAVEQELQAAAVHYGVDFPREIEPLPL